ncbi:hypothetical protein COT49_02760, partial [candidate division WWE3 bacterium CG08_land_8_20_14_0_20_40_13]
PGCVGAGLYPRHYLQVSCDYPTRGIDCADSGGTPSCTPSATIPGVACVQGSGLWANYYQGIFADCANDGSGTNCPYLKAQGIDPTLNHDYSTNPPVAGMCPDEFSVTWDGWILIPTSGTWTFYVRADDGVQLQVNGSSLVDYWHDQDGSIVRTGTRTYSAGWYPIHAQLYDRSGGSSIIVEYSGPGFSRAVIPSSNFSSCNRPCGTIVASPISLGASSPTNLASLSVSGSFADSTNNLGCIESHVLNVSANPGSWPNGSTNTWVSLCNTSTCSVPWNTPTAKDGLYYFSQWGKSTIGQELCTATTWDEDKCKASITIDKTPPIPAGVSLRVTDGSISNGSCINNASVTATSNFSDATTGIKTVQLYGSNIANRWPAVMSEWGLLCSASNSGTCTGTFTPPDGDGTYNFWQAGWDNTGNYNCWESVYPTPPSPCYAQVAFDRAPPVINSISAQTNCTNFGGVEIGQIDASWSASDTGCGGSALSYLISLDNQTSFVSTGSSTTKTYPNLTPGNHTIYLKAIDALGNTSAVSSKNAPIASCPLNKFKCSVTANPASVITGQSSTMTVTLNGGSGIYNTSNWWSASGGVLSGVTQNRAIWNALNSGGAKIAGSGFVIRYTITDLYDDRVASCNTTVSATDYQISSLWSSNGSTSLSIPNQSPDPTFTVTGSPLYGWDSDISLSFFCAGSGGNCIVTPVSGTTFFSGAGSLFYTVSQFTNQNSPYIITITATGSGISKSNILNMSVTTIPDYSLSAYWDGTTDTSRTVNLGSGSSANSRATVSFINGWASNVPLSCTYKIGSSSTTYNCSPSSANITTNGGGQVFSIPYSVTGTYSITIGSTAIPTKSANLTLNVLGSKSCAIKSSNYPNLTTYAMDDVSLFVESQGIYVNAYRWSTPVGVLDNYKSETPKWGARTATNSALPGNTYEISVRVGRWGTGDFIDSVSCSASILVKTHGYYISPNKFILAQANNTSGIIYSYPRPESVVYPYPVNFMVIGYQTTNPDTNNDGGAEIWWPATTGDPPGVTTSIVPTSCTPNCSPSLRFAATQDATVTKYYIMTQARSTNDQGRGIWHSYWVTLDITPTPYFTVTASPATRSIYQGGQTTYTVTFTGKNGWTSNITPAISGCPANASCVYDGASSFAPSGSGTIKNVTVTTQNITPPGTYNLTFTGDAQRFAMATLEVKPLIKSCSISANPLSVVSGATSSLSASYFIDSGSLSPVYEWNPVGVGDSVGSFNPATAVTSTWTSPNVGSASQFSLGLKVFESGNSANYSTCTKTVAVSPTVPSDIFVSLTPSSRSIVQGSQTSYTATFTALNGWNTALTPSLSGCPANTACSFDNTGSFVPSSSGTARTVNITSTISSPVNTFTIQVNGNPSRYSTSLLTITQSNRAPSCVISSPSGNVVSGSSVTVQAVFADPDGDTPNNYSWTTSAGNPSSSTNATYSWTAPSVASYPLINLTVYDKPASDPSRLPATCFKSIPVIPRSDFSVSISPASRSVVQGSSTTYTATFTAFNGWSEPTDPSITACPVGAICSFKSGDQWAFVPSASGTTKTINVSVGASTDTGTYTIKVSGNTANITRSATASLEITQSNRAPTCTITSPVGNVFVNSVNTAQATASDPDGNLTIAGYAWVSSAGSYSSSITNPTNWTAPAVVSSPTLTLTVRDTGGLTGTCYAFPIVVPAPTYSIVISPTTRTILQGGNTSYTATFTAFNNWSSAITPIISGCPANSTCSFDISTAFVPLPSGTARTINVTTTTGVAASTYTISVVGDILHIASATLIINPLGVISGITYYQSDPWSCATAGATRRSNVSVSASPGSLNTSSNSNGDYQFSLLNPNDYLVTVTPPVGMVSKITCGGNSRAITIPATGGSINNVNFVLTDVVNSKWIQAYGGDTNAGASISMESYPSGSYYYMSSTAGYAPPGNVGSQKAGFVSAGSISGLTTNDIFSSGNSGIGYSIKSGAGQTAIPGKFTSVLSDIYNSKDTTNLPSGSSYSNTIYKITSGSISTINFSKSSGTAVLIANSDLTITGNITASGRTPFESPVIIVVQGNVKIDPSVDQIEATIVATGSITVNSSSNSSNEKRLVVTGGLYATNGVYFKRDLAKVTGENNKKPTIVVIYNPSPLVLKPPMELLQVRTSWKEI